MGWIRDLTRECVEPNPGPMWKEIYEKVMEYSLRGEDFWAPVNDYFESLKDGATHDDVKIFVVDKVATMVTEDERCQKIFNMNLTKALEFFEETSKGKPCHPFFSPTTSPPTAVSIPNRALGLFSCSCSDFFIHSFPKAASAFHCCRRVRGNFSACIFLFESWNITDDNVYFRFFICCTITIE